MPNDLLRNLPSLRNLSPPRVTGVRLSGAPTSALGETKGVGSDVSTGHRGEGVPTPTPDVWGAGISTAGDNAVQRAPAPVLPPRPVTLTGLARSLLGLSDPSPTAPPQDSPNEFVRQQLRTARSRPMVESSPALRPDAGQSGVLRRGEHW